ncbi:hypothetical protein [uncultured Meiothermus sp.]|jgi:hypothetical protein|uniref:hypothetical protein n=1 Tax=uncultured Meiothermus sp. TaxID=157471 RepID=UPI0026181843|nr:hypothetical protein [uncultured Meiothermus sp.]
MQPEPRQNRNPDTLHPNFRPAFERWREAANAWLATTYGQGQASVLIVETFRTAERQEWLWKIGRVRGYGVFGRPVTWTTDSAHEIGHAVDVVPQLRQGQRWVARWDLLAELYKAVPPGQYGLETIPGELPHLQTRGLLREGVVPFARRMGLRFNQVVRSTWPQQQEVA